MLAGYTLISARFEGKVAHGSRQPFTTGSPSSTRLERDPRGDPFRFRLFPNPNRTQTPSRVFHLPCLVKPGLSFRIVLGYFFPPFFRFFVIPFFLSLSFFLSFFRRRRFVFFRASVIGEGNEITERIMENYHALFKYNSRLRRVLSIG